MNKSEKIDRCIILSTLKGYYRDVIILAKQAIRNKIKRVKGGNRHE